MINVWRSKTLRHSNSVQRNLFRSLGSFELTDYSEGIIPKKYNQEVIKYLDHKSLSPKNEANISAKDILLNRQKIGVPSVRNPPLCELPYIRQYKVSSCKNLPHPQSTYGIVKKPIAETFRKKSVLNHIVKIDNKPKATFPIQSNEKKEKITLVPKRRQRMNSEYIYETYDKKDSDGFTLGVKAKKTNSFAYSQKGVKEDSYSRENQDSYVCIDNIFKLKDFGIYGVMDGHGTNGHLVSRYLKSRIEDFFTNINTYLQSSKLQVTITSSMYEDRIFERLRHNDFAMLKKFNKVSNDELISEKFDVHFSGSTCILIFKLGANLIVSNTGDSRAIIVKENRKKQISKGNIDPCCHYEVEPLSKDHKPELREEKDRIEKAGGKVAQYIEEDGSFSGPFRVWVRGEKYPGLAMSRSIGDHIAKEVGVTYEPEISVYPININCKYLVVASDGLWDFVSNEDVMEIVNPFFLSGDAEGASEELVRIATEMWKKEEGVIDDITVVVSFIGNPHVKKGTF